MALFFRKRKEAIAKAAVNEGLKNDSDVMNLEPDEIAVRSQVPLDTTIDLSDFWYDIQESLLRHTCPALTVKRIEEAEQEFGHELPLSYIQLKRKHNGGLVNRCRYHVPISKIGYPDMIYITDIMGIGREVPYSLCGKFGSRFLIESRKHNPDIGIVVCNTTLPGRALVFLDYRNCDDTGESCVTWADAQEHIELLLARNFNDFISALERNIVER